MALTDAIAPEHLEIETHDPERLAAKIRNAGAIFLGQHTPEAIGDYVAGSNHVLPTARSARFSSGLGVLDFMKRTSILRLDADALGRLGPAAIALGEAEGLDAHARSVAHAAQSPMSDAAQTGSSASSRSRSTKARSAAPARTSSMSARSRSTTCSRTIRSRRPIMRAGPTRCISRSPRTGWCSTSAREDGTPVMAHLLSLTPFRRIVKDYFLICDSYYKAIRTATPSQIEAIDMGRRGLHNEGSELLMERLKEKIEIDFDTARRLFTLICVLHWKG